MCFISAAILQSPVKIFAAGVRTVALSGQSAPSVSGGVTYESFGSHYDSFAGRFFRGPALNDAGQTAFRAGLTGSGVGSTNNQGVWSEGSGNLALVARTGNQAAGAPGGVNFRIDPEFELYSPVLNDAGQSAFYGGLTNGSVGFWSEGSGDLSLVARSRVQAPGACSRGLRWLDCLSPSPQVASSHHLPHWCYDVAHVQGHAATSGHRARRIPSDE